MTKSSRDLLKTSLPPEGRKDNEKGPRAFLREERKKKIARKGFHFFIYHGMTNSMMTDSMHERTGVDFEFKSEYLITVPIKLHFIWLAKKDNLMLLNLW